MNKTATLIIICLLSATVARAQPVTLRDTGLVLVSHDSNAIFKDLSVLSAVGQPAANGTWDLSQARYVYPWNGYFEREAPFTSAFPAASYCYRGGVQYGQNFYTTYNYYAVDSAGIFMAGRQSMSPQAFSRSFITGNSYDSLFFPAQITPFSPSLTLRAFPATMGSAWGSHTSYTTQLYANSIRGSLSHAPMSVKSHLMLADTIVGWGRMRVRMRDSNRVSEYVPVLQVHELTLQTDSFFLNGVPAPDSILNYLGFAQGASRTYYGTKFLRPGEVEPLLYADLYFPYYGPYAAIVNLMHLPVAPTGVAAARAGRLSVYPNPSATREVKVVWPGALAATLRYALTEFAGRQLALGELHANEWLKLQQSLPAGIYSLTVVDSDGARESVPLLLR